MIIFVWINHFFAMKRIVWIGLFFVTGAFGQQVKPMQFQELIHDFGYVDQDGGAVTYSFQFANVSNRPVKILSVQASCGCTTPDWTKDPIEPGGSGFVQASYDPKGRPGYFNKSLTVATDADSNPVILQIKGQVSMGNGLPEPSEFRTAVGNLKFKTSSFNLGKVFRKDEFSGKEFPLYNGGEQPVTLIETESPSYIKVEMTPSTIQPGDHGKLRILYNGLMRDAYGFQSDNIAIHTDDNEMPVKSFSVYATLVDYFPVLSREELTRAPVLRLPVSTFDMGKVKQHQNAQKDLVIANAGKSKLEIAAIQPNCECIVAVPTGNELKPGDEVVLKITFNPGDRLGTQQKSITIYSNDPQNPAQRITFKAYVE